MSQFHCFIQAGSDAETRGGELERRLRALHANYYPTEQATIRWVAIPPGYMFLDRGHRLHRPRGGRLCRRTRQSEPGVARCPSTTPSCTQSY